MKRIDKKNKRKKQVLDAIIQFLAENNYPPSILDIMDATHMTSTSVVRFYLDELEADGSITRLKGKSRSIVVARGENDRL